MNLIAKLEQEEITRARPQDPRIRPGDTVIVKVTWSRATRSASRPTRAW